MCPRGPERRACTLLRRPAGQHVLGFTARWAGVCWFQGLRAHAPSPGGMLHAGQVALPALGPVGTVGAELARWAGHRGC